MSSRDEVAGVVGSNDVRRSAVLSDETQAEDFARHQVVTAAINLRVDCCKLVTGGIPTTELQKGFFISGLVIEGPARKHWVQ